MKATIDSVGRIVVPKPLRDALGLSPGTTVDISRYGAGLQLIPTGRTAHLVGDWECHISIAAPSRLLRPSTTGALRRGPPRSWAPVQNHGPDLAATPPWRPTSY